MNAGLEAWRARRSKVVGLSMSRHRLVKPGAGPPPVGLADKFGSLYARAVLRHLMAFALEYAKAQGVRNDAAASTTMAGLTFHFADTINATLTEAAGAMVNEVSDFNKNQVGKTFQELVGIPYTDTPRLETILDGHLTENVNLITRMTDEALGRVRAVVDANRGGNLKDFIRDIRRTVDVSASRAQLIARDQTLKLNGNLTRERNVEAGIDRYEWVTSTDERVRHFHSELNGTEHSWDAPPVIDKKGRREHPGGDYQCRCTANPIIDLDAIAAKNNAPEIQPTWMDKTRPEFTTPEAADFHQAPVGFLSRWQLNHSAKGVNPHTGPSWFGKPQRAMTPAERAQLATSTESLQGAHSRAVETGRREKTAEALRRAVARGPVAPREPAQHPPIDSPQLLSAKSYKANNLTTAHALKLQTKDRAALAAMSDAQRKGLDAYTGAGFRGMNDYLRNGEDAFRLKWGGKSADRMIQGIKENIQNATEAMNALTPVPSKTTLFRGESYRTATRIEALENASHVDFPGFGSFTRHPDKVEGFAGGQDFKVVYRVLDHSGAVHMEGVSLNPNEFEALFRPGTRFRIVNRRRAGNALYLDITED